MWFTNNSGVEYFLLNKAEALCDVKPKRKKAFTKCRLGCVLKYRSVVSRLWSALSKFTYPGTLDPHTLDFRLPATRDGVPREGGS